MNHLNLKLIHIVIVLILNIAVLKSGIVIAADTYRIYPTNEVTIYSGDKKIGRYTMEAPLPEGALIKTHGHVK